MPQPKDPSMRFISRIDVPEKNTFGWNVRFRRKGESTYNISKFFSDKKYKDSKEAALKAAKFWRDGVEQNVAPKQDAAEASARARSMSGVPGIHLYVREEDGPEAIDKRTGKTHKSKGHKYHQKPKRRTWVDANNDPLGYAVIQANWDEVDEETGETRRVGRCWSLEKHALDRAVAKAVKARGDALGWSNEEKQKAIAKARRGILRHMHRVRLEKAGKRTD